MKVAIIHLTRMQRGYVCVAGVNVDDGQQVRPVAPRGRLHDTVTTRRGGPFDMATVVDLGATRAVGQAPEVEDHEFTTWHARATQPIEPEMFWDMLGVLSRPTLRDIFGPDLQPTARGRASVPKGSGLASLGCLRPRGRPALYLENRPNGTQLVRLCFGDGDMQVDLSVTDLRLYRPDHATVDPDLYRMVRERIEWGVPLLLSVGLTRPFAAQKGDPRHWLQVNNLHLQDDPAWRLVAEPPPASQAQAPQRPRVSCPSQRDYLRSR